MNPPPEGLATLPGPAPDGLETLATVRRFLARIAREVPAELVSEVRAAAKLLETAEIELNDRHVSLSAETGDLVDLCLEIGRLLDLVEVTADCVELNRRRRAGGPNLSALATLWQDARTLAMSLIVVLQRIESDPGAGQAEQNAAAGHLERLYSRLGAHARSRLTWQSVFPRPTPEGTGAPAVTDRKDLR